MDLHTSSKEATGNNHEDARFEAIEQTILHFGRRKEALLEVLNVIQQNYGYLPENQLEYVSYSLY